MKTIIKSVIFLTALVSFFTLFFLDSRNKIGDLFLSFRRSLRMAKYNYPFCFIMSIILFSLFLINIFIIAIIAIGFADAHIYDLLAMYKILNVLFLPIVISFFTNFYIKRLHDQFNVYFRQSTSKDCK